MRAVASCLVAVIAAGCSGAAEGPPEILYGVEECSHCRMIISEERYAAAARDPSGDEQRFDDLGCLLASREAGRQSETKIWVHDAQTGVWLEAATAWFLRTDRAATPMGSGVMAFADRAAAEARAGRGDTVYDWAGILEQEIVLEDINEEKG